MMESKGIDATPKFCGNLLVRRTKRRSFINKVTFRSVFGVLTDDEFEYYESSEPWTRKEKPVLSINTIDIQSVEAVDDVAFSRPLCFQVTYTSHVRKDESSKTIYLAAHETEEFRSWINTLRSACSTNPICLAYYHPGKFTGKSWTCCTAIRLKDSPGCKPCTIPGIPDRKKHKYKLSPAVEFNGFMVVANESFDSNLPGSLPFKEGDELTITDATGKDEWKAYSGSSTSGYGLVPKECVTISDLTMEPWFFGEIPTGIATAVLREQTTGCFILRCSGTSTIILSFRAEFTVKHVEVVFDDSSQNYRIKDGSDSVSYANFLQFETIQQLIDQYKHNPTLGVTLETYPTPQNVEEIWRIDSKDVIHGDEHVSTLPWAIAHGKFQDQHALVHGLRETSTNSVKEKFINHARILMTLHHDNIISLYGLCTKGSRLMVVQSYLPKGNLSCYLSRNASLLLLHPCELVNVANQILLGMVYLEDSGIVHGELVADNCLVGDDGTIKISGFQCARSSWCFEPLDEENYTNKVAIPAPELETQNTSKTDAWAYGLLVYTIITANQKPIRSVEEVLRLESIEDILDQLNGLTDVMTLCLRTDPESRPSFKQLHQRSSARGRLQSTPSESSCSLEGSLSLSNGLLNSEGQSMCDTPEIVRGKQTQPENKRVNFELEEGIPSDWNDYIIPNEWKESLTESINSNMDGTQSGNVIKSLKMAKLAALNAKALQKRAEAEKEQILNQVQEAEAKCLKEIEYITRSFMSRLNEANDRAAEAEQARYIAEKMKRLTEEKLELYKYDSKQDLYDMQSLLDQTVLERDEFMTSLKTLGMTVESGESGTSTPKRTDSLENLERKYQRYISTSDRMIQNMKTQLNEITKQRDSLMQDRDEALLDGKEARALLDDVLKEKEDLEFRLEESNCEIERLEETISMMMQKRQKAERERDQLQILTDLSLMKLRQAEKPKKRHSVSSLPENKEERELERERRERRDPNLRRLSMQLMNLMTPGMTRRSSEDTIYETSEVSSSDEAAFSSLAGSEDELSVYRRGRRQGRVVKPPLAQLEEINIPNRASSPRDSESETELTPSPTGFFNGGFFSEDQNEKSDSEQEISNENQFIDQSFDNDENSVESVRNETQVNGLSDHEDFKDEEHLDNRDSEQFSDLETSTDQNVPTNYKGITIIMEHKPLMASNSLPYPIPTLRIEEVSDPDDDVEVEEGVPEIAISLVDENANFADASYDDQDIADERAFVISGVDNSNTRMVYSFDNDDGSMRCVPQTSL